MAKRKAAGTVIGSIFQVRDFTAGVNLRSSPTTIQPNQARRLSNGHIGNPGELSVFPGYAGFMDSLGARRIQGGRRIYIGGVDPFTILADNGTVYTVADDGTVSSGLVGSLSTTAAIDFPYDGDMVAVFDGANVPKKSTNGTAFTQLGISAPGVAPTASAVAGGSLVDATTYRISYAYYNSNLAATGNESATVNQAAAGANLTVRVSVTASADPQVTHIKIYAMDVTAGETVRRLAATIANATTTHDITANNWDGQEEPATDHNVAEAMSFGCVWKNRWWGRDGSVGNRIRFSQIFQPMAWPDTYFVDIPFTRGEDIQALVPLGDTLIVFGFTQVYIIFGQTSLDFEVRPALGTETGALGFRAVDVIESGVVHAGASGVYLFNGSSDELLSYPIDVAWRAYVDAASASELARTPLVYHKQHKELRIGVSQVYPTADRGEWILDLNRSRNSETGPAWFATDRTIGGYIQWDGEEGAAGGQGRLFSWAVATASLWEERTGTSADGADLVMRYEGYTVPLGLQVGRVIDTYLEYQPADGTLSVDLKVDGSLMGAQEIDLGTGLAVIGEAIIGTSVISSGDRSTLCVTWPLNAEGRAAQFYLTYTGQGSPKFFTYGHNIMPEPLPRGL
jgi:hypothetical protein